jgi:hypothetical protein
VTGRSTIYVGDYVLPTERLTVATGGALTGWDPEHGTPGEVVALDDGAAEATVKILGGMTGHARKWEPDVPSYVAVPVGKIARTRVFLVPQRIPATRRPEGQEVIEEKIAARVARYEGHGLEWCSSGAGELPGTPWTQDRAAAERDVASQQRILDKEGRGGTATLMSRERV